MLYFFFFFNDTATTEIYTLSLHDALPISREAAADDNDGADVLQCRSFNAATGTWGTDQCPHDGGIDQNIYGSTAPWKATVSPARARLCSIGASISPVPPGLVLRSMR